MKMTRSKNLTLYFSLLLFLVFLLSLSETVSAQVTIGSGNDPNEGALLDLKEEQKTDGSANSTKGLGLPRVALNALITLAADNNDLKNTIDNTLGTAWDKSKHIGLVVYNLADRIGRDGSVICPGVYVWDGTTWIRLFKPCIQTGEISTLTCGTHSMSVIKDVAVTTGNTLAIPYSGKTGADIVLANNQVLGSANNGLTVVANGAQTLSAASGTINIKVTGTPTIAGNFNLTYTIGGKSCTIAITSVATEITGLTCAGVTGTRTVTQPSLTAISLNDLTIPYTKTGGNISLTNNTALGTSNKGLTVQVRNNQTLTTASGTINIKIVGTPTEFGMINVPVTVNGNTCNIAVTITQSAGTIGTLTCGSNSITVIKDVAVTTGNTFAIPYSGKMGANIVLANNQVLGSATNGLTVVANGAQTLSAASGTINIKVAGTPTIAGSFTVSYSVGEKTCTISVTSVTSCVAPQITVQPTDVERWTQNPGGAVTSLFVSATGTAPLSYQWQRAPLANTLVWANVTGATSSTYAPSTADYGYYIYRCEVRNICGSVMSTQRDVIVGCGAKTTSGTWLTFMCYNLGVVGSPDPFTPNPELDGDLYQWGRPKDNHQLRTSETITNVFATNNTATAPATVIGKFIVNTFLAQNNDWRQGGGENKRWGDGTTNTDQAKADNDPCPLGWKVPSQAHWQSIFKASGQGIPGAATANEWKWTTSGFKVGHALFLPAAGHRKLEDGTHSSNNNGYYWSGATDDKNSYALNFRASQVIPDNLNNRGYGFSIRCVLE